MQPKILLSDTETSHVPKVLLYDLETSPIEALVWGRYDQNVAKVLKESQIICMSWNWLHEDKFYVKALPDYLEYKRNPDSNLSLLKELHKLHEEADILLGHNSFEFDDKVARTDFWLHGLPPTPPHKSIDTLKAIRDRFRLSSNKLGDVCERLGIGSKVRHPGIDMWAGCLEGDMKSWDLMKKYCLGDTKRLLKPLYLKTRPWMIRHPSMIPQDRAHFACPSCEGKNLMHRGFAHYATGKRPRYWCKNPACGKWSLGVWVKGELRIR